MEHLHELEDDYKHMSPWYRELLRDMAKDFRKRSAQASTTTRPRLSLVPVPKVPAIGASEQLSGQVVKGAAPLRPTKPVRGK
jgi:hypothetical protein